MPDVRNCKRCGRIYNYIGGSMLCPTCRDKDEEDFKLIKEYLYDNPGASMAEISSALDISSEKITRFLREGRLEIIGNINNLILECEKCGRAIKTGRFCDECSSGITQDFSSAAKKIESSINRNTSSSSDRGMRYINKDTKK